MSYSPRTGLDSLSICKFHNPLTNNPSNCLRDNQCHFKHLTLSQFESFCYNQSPHTLRDMAFCYQSCDNFSCSNYVFGQLIQIDSNHTVNNFGFAQSFEGLNEYQSASKYYLNALKLSPNDDRCHSLYAQFLHNKLNDLKTSKKYYVNALKLNTSNPFTHCNYGKLLQDLNAFDDAEYHYLKCINMSSKHRKCLSYLANLYHYNKIDLNKSKKYFDRLIGTISMNKINIYWRDYFEYGKLLKDMNIIDKCIINFKIALKHCKNDKEKGNIYYEMGLVYDALIFDVENAKYYFGKAMELNYKKYNKYYKEFCQYNQLEMYNNNNGNGYTNQTNDVPNDINNSNRNNSWNNNVSNINNSNDGNGNNTYINQSNNVSNDINNNSNVNNTWNNNENNINKSNRNNNNTSTNSVHNATNYNENNNVTNNCDNGNTNTNNNYSNFDQRPPHENINNNYNTMPPHQNINNNNNNNKYNNNTPISNQNNNNNNYNKSNANTHNNNTNNTNNNWKEDNPNVSNTNQNNVNNNTNNNWNTFTNDNKYNTNTNNTNNNWQKANQNVSNNNWTQNNQNTFNNTTQNNNNTQITNTNNNNNNNTNNNYNNNSLNNWTEFKQNIAITNESDESKESINNNNKTISLSTPQIEFKLYLQTEKLFMYYNIFVNKGYNDMRYLDILDYKLLINEIGMNKIHCKYFIKQINKFINGRSQFELWLKGIGNDLYSEYIGIFERNGIFNFESFYRIVKNKKCLIQMFGKNNEFDAKLIWNNTPKEKRKLNKIQMQQEGK